MKGLHDKLKYIKREKTDNYNSDLEEMYDYYENMHLRRIRALE